MSTSSALWSLNLWSDVFWTKPVQGGVGKYIAIAGLARAATDTVVVAAREEWQSKPVGGSPGATWLVASFAFVDETGQTVNKHTFGPSYAKGKWLTPAIIVGSVPFGGAWSLGHIFDANSKDNSENWLVRFSSQGAILWSKVLKLGGMDFLPGAAHVPSGGGVWVAGGVTNWQANHSEVLMRLSESGQVVTKTGIDSPSGGWGGGDFALASSPGGGVVVVGTFLPDDAQTFDIYAVSVDAKGDVLWKKHYASLAKQISVGVLAQVDVGHLLVANRFGEYCAQPCSLNHRLGFVSIGSKGSVVAETDVGMFPGMGVFGSGVYANAVVRRADGGILVGGHLIPNHLTVSEERAWMGAFSQDGALLWKRQLGDKPSSILHVVEMGSGKLMAVRQNPAPANKPTATGVHSLLLLDPWGNDTCSSSGSCSKLTPQACQDGNLCTADLCSGAKGCHHVPLPDGVTCALATVCVGGVCVPP